jgi:SAM-dependent methyltransferase
MNEQQYWDKQHDKYAATDWIDKPSLFAEWSLQYLPKGSLLDLGAGQAQDSRFFKEQGFTVTATDISEHGIELAKPKSPGIEFEVIDLSKPLSYQAEQFDVVYAHLSLHYFDTTTTEALFSEIYRILKPGGVLAALFNTDEDPEIAEGEIIEPNYLKMDGIQKRYFSPDAAKDFAKDFEILVSDSEGSTYKDSAKGIHNLIRLIAKKQS